MPRLKPRPLRVCREESCRARFTEGARWMDFCSTACKRTWQNRALKRGSMLYRVAMQWRGHKRSHTRGAKNPPNPHFGAMTQTLDEWRREDEAMRKVSDARIQAAAKEEARPSHGAAKADIPGTSAVCEAAQMLPARP